MRALFLTAALVVFAGCGTSLRPVPEGDRDGGVDGGVTGDASVDTAPPGGGDLGAPCSKHGDCLSGFCLSIGRCSKACPTPGACPNSPNWTCVAIPMRGAMCDCDERSKSEVACNGFDDNCDGVIDEGSPKCGDKCVDTQTDPMHCGGCDKACPSGPNGTASCAGGTCTLTCATGFANCDGVAANGCEADLANAAHCGKCGNACKVGEACSGGACVTSLPVDVTVLMDVTGSNHAALATANPALRTRLATPLLAIADVLVGVSYTAEFPISPYGSTGDRPFQGGSEPIAVESTVHSFITTYPKLNGADGADGMVEALGTLAGLPLHPTSTALACSAGRIAGGCFRSGARKVVVLVTDSLFHNGPHPTATGLYEPYTGITPAPQEWPAVLKSMTDAKVTLLFFVTIDASAGAQQFQQYKRMLTDLGQPSTDAFAASGALADSAADAIVARIKAIRAGG